MPARYRVEVAARNAYGCSTELVLETPRGFEPLPGQFVHVLCGGDGRILRRPYSVTVSRDGDPSLLVRPIGEGSRWLCEREAGERIDLLGPLGRPFSLLEGEEHVLVAGGVGIAPLRFLAQALRRTGRRAVIFWGMERAEDYAGLPELLAEGHELRLATRDGSAGHRGTALDLLAREGKPGGAPLYACGPRGMLSALVRGLDGEAAREAQVSVEERMACGVGACRGCVVPAAYPGGGYVTACREGPVFFAGELDWDRM